MVMKLFLYPVFSVLNAVNCTLRITNHKFSPPLYSSYSTEFQALKRQLENLVMLGWSSGKNVVQLTLLNLYIKGLLITSVEIILIFCCT